MDIRNPKSLKQAASQALARGREPQNVITVYAGATVLISAVLTLANYWLSHQISGTGGLSNLGTRSILSTAQTVLPIVQMVVLMCLELGYLHAMMRIARGQYADHTDLKVGFQRFWPMLRMTLLQSLLYFAVGMAIFYFSIQIYMFTPWAEPLIELLLPYAASGSVVPDDATAMQVMEMTLPAVILFLVVYLAVIIPVSFRFRMADYALLDDPKAGAIAALRTSRRMMRRNCLNLFKLDLHLWWYYLLSILSMAVCYGDMLLPMLGIELPLNATVSYFLFYGAYLVMLFSINYFLRNQVETSYVMAYESLGGKPKESGAVLGSIFQM